MFELRNNFESTGKNVEDELLSAVKKEKYVASEAEEEEKEKIIQEKFGHLPEIEQKMMAKHSLHEIYDQLIDNSYLKYPQALEAAKESQPEKLPFFAENLREQIQRNMSVLLDQDDIEIKFITAVGTHLDRYHGIDAVVVMPTEKGEITVTLDLTTNPNKDSYKANHIITVPAGGFDSRLDKAAIIEFNNQQSIAIAEQLLSKFNNKNKDHESKRRRRQGVPVWHS